MRIELCRSLRADGALQCALGVSTTAPRSMAFGGIATDSREVKCGDLFVALPGERTHGAAHIAEAVQRGAAAVLLGAEVALDEMPIPMLQVADPMQALLEAAACYRRRSRSFVVAIGGSTGKTTTKEGLAAILAQKGSVAYSEGNYNSTLGAPLSVLSFEETDAWVVELGINHPGEMEPLAWAMQPDLAVLTNVGTAHVGNFGSFDTLLFEKAKIAGALSPNGCLLLPAELPLSSFSIDRHRVYRIGTDCRMENVFSDETGVCGDWVGWDRGITDLRWCVPGRIGRHTLTVLTAAAVLSGCNEDQLRTGLALAAERIPRLKTVIIGDRLLIDDTYNASPESVAGALEVLCYRAAGRSTVAVLGDMLELGDRAQELHIAVGRAVEKIGIDRLFTYGPLARSIALGAKLGGMCEERIFSFACGQEEELLRCLCTVVPQRAAILFKASGKMQMSRLVAAARRKI